MIIIYVLTLMALHLTSRATFESVKSSPWFWILVELSAQTVLQLLLGC